jgi:hypothetical protein
MASLGQAKAALEAGEFDDARSMFMSVYEAHPGEAAAGLAEIALETGQYQRAENLARTALENGEFRAHATLADAVGRQGRRAEAERIALDATSEFPDWGLLLAILGEQRVRQADWVNGTEDLIDAVRLDEHGEVPRFLHRVLRDLTQANAARRIPTEEALKLINRLDYETPNNNPYLAQLFAGVRRALNSRSALDVAPPARTTRPPSRRAPSGPPKRRRPVARPASAAPRVDHSAPPPPQTAAPPLVEMMRHDRELNQQLQGLLQPLGLPNWPSDDQVALDTIPRLRPSLLNFDRDAIERGTLNLTDGDVGTEILMERALESLMHAIAAGSARPPQFDEKGLVQLEVAAWDGILEEMRPIPDIYLGERGEIDQRLLALAAFVGECIIRRGNATWTFEKSPTESTIETFGQRLKPFEVASEWLAADDKDDVHLERIVGEARVLGEIEHAASPRMDPTREIKGRALAMKLAELWLGFRHHPPETAQNVVADAIRPLNVLPGIIFFALDADFAPPMAGGADGEGRYKGEVAIAYVRDSGLFLCLGSRKQFARAVGGYIGTIQEESIQKILDMFRNFHRPTHKIVRSGENGPRIERREGTTILRFTTLTSSGGTNWALVHQPDAAVRWRLLRS